MEKRLIESIDRLTDAVTEVAVKLKRQTQTTDALIKRNEHLEKYLQESLKDS